MAHLITESGAEAPAYVGVYVEDLTGWYAAHFKTDRGVLVTGVAERSPAARHGLQQGDVITAVDRQEVVSVRRFRQIVTHARPGQRMLFDILRGGWPLKVAVELGRAGIPHLEPLARPPVAPRSAEGTARSDTSASPAAEARASRPAHRSTMSEAGLESRFRDLERTVDSLQRELSNLRRDIGP